MKARHAIGLILLCMSWMVFFACRSSSQTPAAATPVDASDASRATPVDTPSAAPQDASTASADAATGYAASFITSCPPGIKESESVHCPTVYLTAEQVESIAKASKTSRKYSERCPSGMREVEGTYCAGVSHTCTACKAMMMSDNHVEPCYFCDRFAPGSAVCKGKETPMHLCIDEYEHPNVPGQNPTIMTSWYDAHRLCKAEGKRLCNDQEWTLACEGPEHKPYPYGWERDKSACNIDNTAKRDNQTDGKLFQGGKVRDAELARLWDAKPIAASPRCVSDYGVYDLTGNVDEVTDNVSQGGRPYKDLWKGGHWVGGARNRCRPATDGHNEGFGYYANGFRCCADPKTPPSPK